MSSFSPRRNRQAFRKAQRAAGETGMVCGYTDRDGIPHYVVVPKDASDETIRDLVFQSQHGRPMNRAELLLSAAQQGDFLRAYEGAIAHYLERGPDPMLEALNAED